MNNTKAKKALNQFYQLLDGDVAASLTEQQKSEIEQAVCSLGLVSRHSVDVRKSIPWFGKRYYFVLLGGRDRRRQVRAEESKLVNFLTVTLIIFLLVCLVGLSGFALYLLKSALGIDIFKNYSFGVWDWFKSLSV
ncbi:hypothetical protein VISI1226_13556 [Vibrio sinaloensis DSM 21326]|uniref:3-phosphoshikimate 1-carboxyvinyltransferase n=1 Tax=Vibrio sinaloensis DSM 21326 TaxID=945550 RepID=E8M6V7_PHOS4|nr:hypothetical protein [Vibrio sinaloensis]EGA70261.1 hypothetical protein VISI1226_13556 [Vibrio sinaloensis DSM 21326]